jgi:hypothetical protein
MNLPHRTRRRRTLRLPLLTRSGLRRRLADTTMELGVGVAGVQVAGVLQEATDPTTETMR